MWMMVNLNDEAATPNHTSNSVGLKPTKSIIRKRGTPLQSCVYPGRIEVKYMNN